MRCLLWPHVLSYLGSLDIAPASYCRITEQEKAAVLLLSLAHLIICPPSFPANLKRYELTCGSNCLLFIEGLKIDSPNLGVSSYKAIIRGNTSYLNLGGQGFGPASTRFFLFFVVIGRVCTFGCLSPSFYIPTDSESFYCLKAPLPGFDCI